LDVGHFWLPSTTFILSRARSNLVKKKSGIHKELKEKKSKFWIPPYPYILETVRALKKSVSILHKDNFIRNIKKKSSRLVEK
jgi:hypothetical protein